MSSASDSQLRLCALLRELQDHVLKKLLQLRGNTARETLAAVDRHDEADTIYAVDQVVETAIHAWLNRHWPEDLAVQVVMEGVAAGDPGWCFPANKAPEWILLMDPIDGTRNWMHDKRSAWILAGVAPHMAQPTLADICVAAMTELPSSRAARADQLTAIRGCGVSATWLDLRDQQRHAFTPQPSSAGDCRHGFASLVRFFPDGLAATAEIEEQLWNSLYPEARGGSPVVFNDQYLTTGGQLHELIIGHDRFIGDIRPIVFSRLGLPASLACHPYDLAALLVASEAGVIVEDPLTHAPLTAPLDTTTPVAWCGYANATLAAHIRPALTALLQ
jgi:hypothetical protein